LEGSTIDNRHFYANGDILRLDPYLSPDKEAIELWRKEWFSTFDYSNFKFMAMGSSIEKLYGKSKYYGKDLDVFFTGDYGSLDNLRNIMRLGITCASKYDFLLDINYINVDVHNKLFWEKDYYYIKYNSFTVEVKYNYIMVRHLSKFTHYTYTELPNGLARLDYKSNESSPSFIKHKNRIHEGQYKSIRLNLNNMKLLPFDYYNPPAEG